MPSPERDAFRLHDYFSVSIIQVDLGSRGILVLPVDNKRLDNDNVELS